jgi:hypothetical protein
VATHGEVVLLAVPRTRSTRPRTSRARWAARCSSTNDLAGQRPSLAAHVAELVDVLGELRDSPINPNHHATAPAILAGQADMAGSRQLM